MIVSALKWNWGSMFLSSTSSRPWETAEHSSFSLDEGDDAGVFRRLWTALERHEVTSLFTVPSVARGMLGSVDDTAVARNIERLLLTGEPLDTTLAEDLLTFLPRSAALWNLYGASELPYVLARHVRRDDSLSPNTFFWFSPHNGCETRWIFYSYHIEVFLLQWIRRCYFGNDLGTILALGKLHLVAVLGFVPGVCSSAGVHFSKAAAKLDNCRSRVFFAWHFTFPHPSCRH
jgi:hypothetical protein